MNLKLYKQLVLLQGERSSHKASGTLGSAEQERRALIELEALTRLIGSHPESNEQDINSLEYSRAMYLASLLNLEPDHAQKALWASALEDLIASSAARHLHHRAPPGSNESLLYMKRFMNLSRHLLLIAVPTLEAFPSLVRWRQKYEEVGAAFRSEVNKRSRG